MKIKLKYKKHGWLAVVGAILIVAAIFAFSWVVTCGIIKLITVCFGLKFSWKVATGIWLVMFLIRGLFSITVKKN